MKKTLNVIILIIIILMVSMQRYIVKAENEIPENIIENIKECMDYITIIWINLQRKNLKNGVLKPRS